MNSRHEEPRLYVSAYLHRLLHRKGRQFHLNRLSLVNYDHHFLKQASQ
ncbi:hypothetical protein QWZ13_07570 [Reinekea marina]|nr:hypothetical protein [Reinekea marina]MDN3648768.1 hypothetical protein [Reinekea marina]